MGKLQQHLNAMTEGDALRNLIGECERLAARITPETAKDLLAKVTEAERLSAELGASGRDVRAELARLEGIRESIVRRAGDVVKAVGGLPAYVALRARLNGDPDSAVWQLDARLAEARARMRRSITTIAAVLLVIAGLGYVFRGVLFPPDPAGDAVRAAQRVYVDGGAPAALKEINHGLTIVPTDTQLLIWQGAWLEEVGDPGAEAAFQRAQAALGEKEFRLERAMVNIQRGKADLILADTTALIAANPNYAEAYFLRANGHQLRGDRVNALADLEKAAALAEAQDNPTLLATTRVRIGELLQSGAMQQ